MSLPKSVAGSERVELSGGYIDVRSLSVDEMEAVQKLTKKNPRAGNILAISIATGEEHDATAAWYNDPSTIAGDVSKLLDAIGQVSGTSEEATFQSRTGDDAGASRQGE